MEILEGLTSEQRGLLLHSKEQRIIEKGTVIFREGDPASGVFQIVSGSVELIDTTPDGKERLVDVMTSGDVFGHPVSLGRY